MNMLCVSLCRLRTRALNGADPEFDIAESCEDPHAAAALLKQFFRSPSHFFFAFFFLSF